MSPAKRACDRASSRRRSGIGERLHSHSRTPDVDPVAIQRACDGEPVRLTQREVTQAVALLRRSGLSILQTALRLRVAPRTVNRHWLKAQGLSTALSTGFSTGGLDHL